MACYFTQWPFQSTTLHFPRYFAYGFRDATEINAKKPYTDRKQLSNTSWMMQKSYLPVTYELQIKEKMPHTTEHFIDKTRCTVWTTMIGHHKSHWWDMLHSMDQHDRSSQASLTRHAAQYGPPWSVASFTDETRCTVWTTMIGHHKSHWQDTLHSMDHHDRSQVSLTRHVAQYGPPWSVTSLILPHNGLHHFETKTTL